MEKGAEPNLKSNTGETALMFAAAEGYTDTVRLLLEGGADVNAVDNEGNTALFKAVGKKHSEIAEVLLASGAAHGVTANIINPDLRLAKD